ncbi:MAG: bifunctional diguanylate cyclase/phosphodiesterase [Oceanococcus sp.]
MTSFLRKYLPAMAAFAVGAGITLVAWQFAWTVEHNDLSRRFEARVNETVVAIESRFFAYRQVLRGGVALFNASDHVSRLEWRAYVEGLKVDEQYPGIQGIGYAQQLRHGDLPAHLSSVRSQGFANYKVRPLDSKRAPTSIVYLEPFDVRNQRAFGYDMYSEATRRAAMERARDTGQPALSGGVTLLQEMDENKQAGTLLYLPVYHRGEPLDTVGQRRAALIGWVYSPFRMNDLMQGILGAGWPDVKLQIYDGMVSAGAMRLYETEQIEKTENSPLAAGLSQQVVLDVAGRSWLVSLEALPAFHVGAYSTSRILLFGGLLLTSLITILVFTLRNSEVRAGGLAREMSDAFRSSEKRQRAILENTADGILTIDQRGTVRSFNKAAESMFGYYAHEVIGHNVAMLMPPRFHEQHDGYVQSMETSPSKRQLGVRREVVGRRRNGEEFPVWLAVNKIPGIGACEYVGSVSDLTDRKKILAELQHLAHHDALTNLPNRALLTDRIEQAVQRGHREGRQVALLMLDLDHFKRINDSLGHHVGDDLLQLVAKRLASCVRSVDTVARMGGDEFVVLISDVVDRAAVRLVVDKLLSELSEPVPVAGHDMIVTPSIGVSIYPQDGEDSQTLLKNADTAMYQAKAAGRGRSKFFDAEMLHKNERRLATETALRHAMERHELSLEYQPQVDMASGRLTGCEALLRWTHPEFGRVPPDQFVPVAEEIGLIRPIGEWVLMTACREARSMQESLGLPLNVAVNISPQQFFHGDVPGSIRKALEQSGLPPSCLEVEITEGVLLENSEATIEMLRSIRAMGVAVAIDDFGTGYSSLSYLTRFPIDKLKIDQSFVRDITIDSSDAAVTSAIIVMAHTLQLAVVAEGVETREQHQFLTDRNCDIAQGYYFGRPMSADDFLHAADGFAAPKAPTAPVGNRGSALH